MLEVGFPPAAVRKSLGGAGSDYYLYEPRVPAGHHEESGRWTTGAFTVAANDKSGSEEPAGAKNPAYQERRLLGEDDANEDLQHGRPIWPRPVSQ